MVVVDGRVTQCFIVRGWREVKNTRVPELSASNHNSRRSSVGLCRSTAKAGIVSKLFFGKNPNNEGWAVVDGGARYLEL